MPKWIHERAEHLLAKNPKMPESEAWALATQQSHALGKSPKGYGTAKGRRVAKKKYDTPEDDQKTAMNQVALEAFFDELQKIGFNETGYGPTGGFVEFNQVSGTPGGDVPSLQQAPPGLKKRAMPSPARLLASSQHAGQNMKPPGMSAANTGRTFGKVLPTR